jgi:hypothetical protein
MRARANGLLPAFVLGAGALLSWGCADVIGANFNRTLPGAGGGMSVSASAVTAAAAGTGGSGGDTVTSATATGVSASASASASGAGGGTTDVCGGSSSDPTVTIYVYVNPGIDGSGTGATDFLTTRAKAPVLAAGFNQGVLATFKLYTSKDGLAKPVLLADCSSVEGHWVTDIITADCECLGYAEDDPTGPTSTYTAFEQANGVTIQNTLLPTGAGTSTTSCMKYSKDTVCTPTKYTGPL